MKFSTSCENKDLAIEVMAGRKTVTRRDKPYKVGEVVDIEQWSEESEDSNYSSSWEPIGKARVKKCEDDTEFRKILCHVFVKVEAMLEGYDKWSNVDPDLKKYYPTNPPLYRIELEVIKDGE